MTTQKTGKYLPRVVIVGRPNVGKSSLLNMLAGRRVSIVDPTAGVTRDRVATQVELTSGPTIELVDTGGYGIDGYEDKTDLTADIERQIARGLAEADLILFVFDAQSGVTPLDETVATMLRHASITAPILLLANKVDSSKFEAEAYNAMQMGFGEPLMISATTRHNRFELVDAITQALKKVVPRKDMETIDEPHVPKIALVGKRNAGKSTLTNALAGEQRVIVNAQEGTTRDSVDVRFEIDGRAFIAIDTAGVRKGKSVKQDIEYYSQHRALRSIRRADVVLLLIDATVPTSQVDSKLGAEILRHYKPVVIVVNKWDLAEKNYTQDEYVEYLDKSMGGLSFAPIIFVSAAKSEGITDVVKMALNLYEQASHRVSTGILNRFFGDIMVTHQPKSRLGKRVKIYFVTQIETHPPTIGLFVNDPDLFDPSYQRFLLGRIRDELPYSEVPIRLLIRPRKSLPKNLRKKSMDETGALDADDANTDWSGEFDIDNNTGIVVDDGANYEPTDDDENDDFDNFDDMDELDELDGADDPSKK